MADAVRLLCCVNLLTRPSSTADALRSTFADDRPQLVILRDPRAVAVSSYFHRRNGHVISESITLTEYLPKILPGICRWISIRYVLFAGLLQDSTVFWYDESVADPHAWHRRFLDSVGLHVPTPVVDGAVDAALRGDFAFNTKRMDTHSESNKEDIVVGRTWVDEVDPDLIPELDGILRQWLPPVVLAKLGVPLAES